MSGKAPRLKGGRFEREVVDIFLDHGISAQRVPISGSAGGRFVGDVTVAIMGDDRTVEAKVRKTGFAQVYRWITGMYAVTIKADRCEPLICLRLSDFAKLAITADKRRLGV